MTSVTLAPLLFLQKDYCKRSEVMRQASGLRSEVMAPAPRRARKTTVFLYRQNGVAVVIFSSDDLMSDPFVFPLEMANESRDHLW